MTDLEMTKLCATAMGFKEARHPIAPVEPPAIYAWVAPEVCDFYSPMTNDAQAMALVKRFRLTVATERGTDRWMVGPPPHMYESAHSDLNRAIVECVAKMTRTK